MGLVTPLKKTEMTVRFTFAAVAAAILGGCALPIDRSPQRAEIERTRPICSGDADCAAKWDAAQLWVVKNAGFKVQTVTSVVIQTYSAQPYDSGLVLQVTKEPLEHGKFKLVARAWCGVPVCRPDQFEAVLRFNRDIAAVGM